MSAADPLWYDEYVHVCIPLRALICEALRGRRDAVSSGAANAKDKALLAIRNPTVWAEAYLGPPFTPSEFKYSCMYRTRGRRVPTTILFSSERSQRETTCERSPICRSTDSPGPYSHSSSRTASSYFPQAPIVPVRKAGEWAAPNIAGQTRQSLKNIASILEELGLTMASVVKTTVFLTDPADFQAMNEAYKEFFPEEPPARSPAKLGIANPGLKVASSHRGVRAEAGRVSRGLDAFIRLSIGLRRQVPPAEFRYR